MESLFAKAIREHLELQERNSMLEQVMPLERYRFHDDQADAVRVGAESAVRLDDTDGLLAAQPVISELDRFAPSDVFADSWGEERSFDWGD